MLSAKEQQILDALEPEAEAADIEIVTVEITGARKAPTIRVYIDADGGVGFDELSSAQSWIDRIVEDLDPFPGAYTLEVSSPGIDRPLRTPRHFSDRIGETAVVRTSEKVDGRANFTGVLEAADEQGIILDCDGERYEIAYGIIKRANIKGVYTFR